MAIATTMMGTITRWIFFHLVLGTPLGPHTPRPGCALVGAPPSRFRLENTRTKAFYRLARAGRPSSSVGEGLLDERRGSTQRLKLAYDVAWIPASQAARGAKE